MAQDFESEGKRITDSATTILTANSDDAVVGLRFANILTTTATLDVIINDAGDSTDRYLIKGVSVPASSSIELVQGGSKIILQNGDVLKAQAGTANAFDCWVSRVDAIST
tara:strand:+ start:513 stop:842 length:330 start_codon:yes stop_codon:yes gene_type:complete